jgi:hypothetical protein
MKNLISSLLILFCISNIQVHAQTKYTINFTPNHLTVNENVDTIHVIATIHPAALSPSGIDLNYDISTSNGDYRPFAVPTFDFEKGDSVAYKLVYIYDHNGPHVRVHHFGLDDFMHAFIKGPDSVFTLTIIDNDSIQDAGIKSTTHSDADIKIFPNPAKGILNISTPLSLSGKLKIDLLDVQGRNLKTYNLETHPDQNFSISLPENVKGLLLLRFETEGNVTYKRVMAE